MWNKRRTVVWHRVVPSAVSPGRWLWRRRLLSAVWCICLQCISAAAVLWNQRLVRRLKPRLHDTTGCQTRCQTRLTTGLTTGCIVYTSIQPVVKPCLSNRLYNPVWQQCWTNSCSFNTVVKPVTTGWMFVYTIQQVVKLVVQPVVSCKRGLRTDMSRGAAVQWVTSVECQPQHDVMGSLAATQWSLLARCCER